MLIFGSGFRRVMKQPQSRTLLLAMAVLTAGLGCSPVSSLQPTPLPPTPPPSPPPLSPPPRSQQTSYPHLPLQSGELATLLMQLEQQLRSSTPEDSAVPGMAHQQQVLYRRLGRDAPLAAAVRAQLLPRWRTVFDHHLGARRALLAMNPRGVKPRTLPPWRIVSPAPAATLLASYKQAEAATGIPWQVLAAVNLVETGMGRIDGISVAGATGPMQFLPSTWAERGIGKGNIRNPHDAIQAAARYLVRRGGLQDIRRGLWGYNNSPYYGTAVLHYSALLRDDPGAFTGLYHWQIHLLTTAGDVWLPEGTNNTSRIPVEQHLRRYPNSVAPNPAGN